MHVAVVGKIFKFHRFSVLFVYLFICLFVYLFVSAAIIVIHTTYKLGFNSQKYHHHCSPLSHSPHLLRSRSEVPRITRLAAHLCSEWTARRPHLLLDPALTHLHFHLLVQDRPLGPIRTYLKGGCDDGKTLNYSLRYRLLQHLQPHVQASTPVPVLLPPWGTSPWNQLSSPE